jgi:hypothetical protein
MIIQKSLIEVYRSYPDSKLFVVMIGLKNVAGLNSSGNLRGMVINANARAVWNFSTNIAKKFAQYEDALVLLNLLLEIAKDGHKAADVLGSADQWEIKAAKLSAMTSAGIFRVLTGVVPLGLTWLSFRWKVICNWQTSRVVASTLISKIGFLHYEALIAR